MFARAHSGLSYVKFDIRQWADVRMPACFYDLWRIYITMRRPCIRSGGRLQRSISGMITRSSGLQLSASATEDNQSFIVLFRYFYFAWLFIFLSAFYFCSLHFNKKITLLSTLTKQACYCSLNAFEGRCWSFCITGCLPRIKLFWT